jgi:hypothetical protein
MIDTRHLLAGLNAMSRAHTADYFSDGHRAGAVISASYLCRDMAVEDGVAEILEDRMAREWLSTPLFAPLPDEQADPSLIDRIVATMADNVDGVRQAGHNVILPSLALKALRDVPEAVTPGRVAGICRLVEAFERSDVPLGPAVDLPSSDDPVRFAESVLGEFTASTERFIGRGQGWSGHLLTYGAALTDLHDLGHHALARRAEDGFHQYLRRIRLGPLDSDTPRPEHDPLQWLPLERAYWEHKSGGDWNLGHVLKYPYGFYRLLALTEDAGLRQRALTAAFRVF